MSSANKSNPIHWGWVMHVCVSNLTIIGSDNGLLCGCHISGQGRQIAHKECKCSCDCGQILREMMDKCDKYECALCQLKEYVLNVERVMGDAIKEIKDARSAELSNTELNRPRDQRGHCTNPPDPRSGDNHIPNTNLPPTQVVIKCAVDWYTPAPGWYVKRNGYRLNDIEW